MRFIKVHWAGITVIVLTVLSLAMLAYSQFSGDGGLPLPQFHINFH